MDLLPHNHPKPALKRLLWALLAGAAAGTAYGALAGYFTDDASAVFLMAIGGAFAGFLIWATPPNVIWSRAKGEGMRSNNTPHSDARANAGPDQTPSARPGGRER